ncbi:hypothetical protein RRG08_001217 [Elysia crispata]|uniref:C-type lectin domain-containing protein n=1 Tax=Elysia crispata TaxID=231223 RepID=A0AAE1EAZ2_9GAST|nr:hypothetical protein RRG08_001217 [Elysia crispata]
MKITLIVGLLAVCAARANAWVPGTNIGLTRNRVFTRLDFHTNTGVMRGFPVGAARKAKVAQEQRRKAALQTLTTQNDCPQGFVRFGDSCFSQSLVATTWETARVACRKAGDGGDLASINSKEELDFIQTKFGGGSNDLRWIGLHKDRPGTPYTWVNGDKVQYLPWVSNYTGQEPTGFVAVSLINLHFIVKPVPTEYVPFLCKTMSSFNSARRDAVDYSNRPVQEKFVEGEKNETEEKIDAREFPEELLIPCREEWGSYEGKCYKFFDGKRKYKDAIVTCKKEGANLLSLHSPRESEFVRTHVMKRPGSTYWLGLSNDENGLAWTDSSPFDYSNWRSGLTVIAPPRKPMIRERNHLERCFKMDSDDLRWESDACSELCYTICVEKGQTGSLPPPTTPGPTTERTTGQSSTPWPQVYIYNGEVVGQEEFQELMKGVLYAGALVPALNASSITLKLNNSSSVKASQKSVSGESEPGGAGDQDPVAILVVLIGSVVLMVATFGAISWRRQYGNFPYPWKSLRDSSKYVNHNLQSILDPETRGVNQRGIYGAME